MLRAEARKIFSNTTFATIHAKAEPVVVRKQGPQLFVGTRVTNASYNGYTKSGFKNKLNMHQNQL